MSMGVIRKITRNIVSDVVKAKVSIKWVERVGVQVTTHLSEYLLLLLLFGDVL